MRAVPRIEGPDLPFLIGVTDAFASRQAPRQSSTLHESCRHPEFATAIFRKPPSRTAPVREAAGSLYPFSIRWVAISRKSVKISAATRVSSRPIIPDSKSLCAASRTPKPTLTESGTATLHRSSSKRSTPEDQRVGPRDRCSTGQGPTRGTHCPGPSNSLALDLNFPTNESSVAAFTRSVNSRFTASISGICPPVLVNAATSEAM